MYYLAIGLFAYAGIALALEGNTLAFFFIPALLSVRVMVVQESQIKTLNQYNKLLGEFVNAKSDRPSTSC